MDIAINEDVWLSVVGLKNEGVMVSRGYTTELGSFNKVQFYKSCLRSHESAPRTFNVGGLAAIPRILAYIVIWVLTPRGFNHATLMRKIMMKSIVQMRKMQMETMLKILIQLVQNQLLLLLQISLLDLNR